MIMMASFLPVIMSKKNKQAEKNMSFIAVYHKFTSILKNTEKKTIMNLAYLLFIHNNQEEDPGSVGDIK